MPTKQSKAVLHTLDRVLSKAGVGSRTESRRWIAAGRVTVDGKKELSPDTWIDMKRQRVTVDGKPLEAKDRVYLLFYKPKGYLTTQRDPEGRPTIYDILPPSEQRLVYVGRLDQDTSGLLILTNDTQFSDYISSPASHVPKTYLVKSSKLLSDGQLDQLRKGVVLSDGLTRPAKVTRIRDSEKYSFFEITITEGRNRQVRRMVEALDAKVLKLVRTGIGELRIGALEIGKTRALTPQERQSLLG
jgi:pseudouridine synthase